MSLRHSPSTPGASESHMRFRCRRLCGQGSRKGVTLVEVIIAVIVLGTTCLAGLAGMIFTLRVADSNLLAMSASSEVRAVAEQLYAVDYATLFSTQIPADVPSNPGGTLTTGAWNTRTDDLNNTPGNPNDDLQMRIFPTITRVREADGLDYALVVIEYEWQDSSFFVPRTRSDALAMIVSRMSSY